MPNPSTLHVRFQPIVRHELRALSVQSGLAESQVLTLLVRLAFRGAIPGLEALRPDPRPQLLHTGLPDLDNDDDDELEDDDPDMPPF
jgi:hypothetical protein